jgi:ATP-dependent Clp protease ATP-binding subunit ClpC
MKKVVPKVKRILNMSLKQAKLYEDWEVKVEHIMIALINDYNNNAIKILEEMGIDIDILHKKIEKSLSKNKSVEEFYDITNDVIPLNTISQNIIKGAEKECDILREDYLDTQHILLSLLKTKNIVNGILKTMKVTYKGYNSQVKKYIIENSIDSPETNEGEPFKSYKKQSKTKSKSNTTPILDNFSIDITKMAIEGKIDPVIGRDKTIQRVAQILARKKKNNPVLIGDPGVGKTTIVEGLALKIVKGESPRTLLNKRIISLDLASLVAGTKYRGQFEERIKGIVDELISVDNVILFLDEVHTIIGAGNASGSMDAANVLKPALSRGDIQLIGATTLDEFRENIEKDGALTRRFQQVIIEPPSVEDTIEILNKIKFSYESFHKVTYPQETIKKCVKLADRYITDREFPDKAIDIMDEVGSRSQVNAKPPENINILEQKIINIKDDKNDVVKSQRYEEAARLRDEERITTEKLEIEKKEWLDSLNKKRRTITPEDVNEVVSIMTGIPLNRLSGDQGKRLLEMEKDLRDSIIGQDEALLKIAQSLRRNRVGIRNPKKPIGSFMFLGPTGVGKTYLAKKLAEYMFGDEDSLIRMDMSEFQEKHSISRLIGSPPGYIGHEEGGQLTEKVRRKPYSIILFDEIEKANKDIYNILLQLLDDGQLTDSLGRKVNFKNCMVIMTSNVGVKRLQDFGAGVGFGTKSILDNKSAAKSDILMDELKKHFAPEFLNRLDDVVIFKSLTKKEIGKIVELEITNLKGRVEEIGYKLQINKTVRDYLIETGYDEDYGARPLNRAIQKYVEDPVSEEILKDKVKEGQTIKVSYVKAKEKIVIKVE